MTDQRGIPNVAVIPTRDHADTLCLDLIDQLCEQGETDKIFVFDNRDEMLPVPYFQDEFGIVDWRHAPGLTISAMWNLGWYESTVFALGGPVNVAILNDDIVIPEGFMETLADRLRAGNHWLVGPDYRLTLDDGDSSRLLPTETVRGTYRNGGWAGWAFMLRGELLGDPLEPIDESFLHWCGDDHLDWQIRKHGGTCGLVKGLPIDHLGGATARLHPKTHEQGWKDLARFKEKYST